MILFGDKTVALFDLWSLEHFFTGCNSAALIGFFYHKFSKQKNEKILFAYQAMTLAILELYWESFEFYLEAGYSYDIITYWLQGVEYMGNRLITDPIMTVGGLFFIRRFPRAKIVAAIFSLIWLYLHLVVFDNCMAVQDLYFNYTIAI